VKRYPSGFLTAFWRGLSGQFFLVTILPLTILILVVAFGSQSLHHNAMRSLVGDRDLRVARAASNTLDQELSNRQMVLELLAEQKLDPLSLPDTRDFFDLGLIQLASDGNRLFSTNQTKEWEQSIQFNPEELGLSPVLLTYSADLAIISVPSTQGGWLVGGFMPRSLINRVLSSFVDFDRTSILVINRQLDQGEPQLLYSSDPALQEVELQLHPGVTQALAGESGMKYISGEYGEYVVAYASIQSVGWGLVAEEEWESISSPLLRNTQLAPLVLAPALLLALLALWYTTRRIIQPLRKLEKQTEALSRGEFDIIREPVGGIPEIQNLQASLIEMSEKLSAAQQSLRSYIGAITSGIENERRNLAQEIHDDTIQNLIALNQRMQMAERNEKDPSQQARLDELQNLLQQTISNLRRLVRGLRPIYLEDLGLSTALEMLAQETQQKSRLMTTFQQSGQEIRLSSDCEVSIYRISQEAINNIIRHAAASQINIHLSFQEGRLELSIQDNGQGFVVPENLNGFSTQEHFGLVGMSERAEEMGAHLSITSTPGQGTSIYLVVPISNTGK
jgi:signal transduction histidine kinase